MPFIPPFGSPPGGAAGASIELDNLGTTAINTNLISDTDSTDDLGSSSINWANLFVDKIVFDSEMDLSSDATDQLLIFQSSFGSGKIGLKLDSTAFGQAFTIELASGTTWRISGPTNIQFGKGGIALHLFPIIDSANNIGIGSLFWNETFTDELILTNVGAAAAAADKLVLSAIDLSAGNTILDINTEGTGVTGTGTPAADRTVAIRVNGTVLYLLASTIA